MKFFKTKYESMIVNYYAQQLAYPHIGQLYMVKDGEQFLSLVYLNSDYMRCLIKCSTIR